MNLQVIPAAQVAPTPWRNGGGLTRELLVWPPLADEWQLRITLAEHDWTPLAKFYTATIANEGTPGEWRTIELSLEDFRLKDAGTSLATWDELDKINLQGTTPRSKPFRLANLRWSSEPGP